MNQLVPYAPTEVDADHLDLVLYEQNGLWLQGFLHLCVEQNSMLQRNRQFVAIFPMYLHENLSSLLRHPLQLDAMLAVRAL